MNPAFGIRSIKTSDEKNAINQVKLWVEKRLSSESLSHIIMVTEIQCNEPDCVPIETLIIGMVNNLHGTTTLDADAPDKWTAKILKPVLEVIEEDILNLSIPVLNASNNVILVADNFTNSTDVVIRDIICFIDEKLQNQSVDKQIAILTQIEKLCATRRIVANEKNIELHLSVPSVIKETVVPMRPRTDIITGKQKFKPSVEQFKDYTPPVRHVKGVRQRGCPCCDPDNIDNIVDKLLVFDAPP